MILFAQLTPHELLHLDAAIADVQQELDEPILERAIKATEQGKTIKQYDDKLKRKKAEGEKVKTQERWPAKLRGQEPSAIHDFIESIE